MSVHLTNAHRCFLQRFVTQSILSDRETEKLYLDCCEEYRLYNADVTKCPLFIGDINNKLSPISMEIRRGIDEDCGSIFYALVNLHQDEASKLATDFDAKEIGFFKRVMDLIIAADDGVCSSVDLVNAAAGLQPSVTVSEATHLLERFSTDHWLTFNKDEGVYWLGPRTLIELLPHLREVYGDAVTDCKFCSNLVVKGQRCDNCDVKVHIHCAARVLGGCDEKLCPNTRCRAPWPHVVPELQRDFDAPLASAAATPASRRNGGTATSATSSGSRRPPVPSSHPKRLSQRTRH